MLKTTKILAAALLAGALMFGVAGAQGNEHGKEMKGMHMDDHGKTEGKKEVTMTGEILDMYCFMNHPDTGQGPDHAKCAASCINKGLPIGFMSNGEVYLVTGKDHDPVASMVAEYAGKQSKVKGIVTTHHGVKALELISIEPAS